MFKLTLAIVTSSLLLATSGFTDTGKPLQGFLEIEKAPLAANSGNTSTSNIQVTNHTVKIGSKQVPYVATAGTLPYKNEKGEIKAHFFFTSYVRSDIENMQKRPIAFCFNGGPGASSVWLQMGLLGPKRVQIEPKASYAPPYGYIDNAYSLLDDVDLVFIDPVSTGYSRANTPEEAKQFHGVDEDIKSVAEFIRLYTTENSRWESPKFIIGESYGTTRAALLVEHLHEECYMHFNGIVQVSSVLNFQTIDRMERSNELTYLLYLPSYTAAAWYHQKLPPDLQKDFHQAIEASKNFAIEEYSLALLKGDQLPAEERQRMVKKLARFTGVSEAFIDKVDLRPSLFLYLKELLKEKKEIIGRFDSRVTGYDVNPCSDDYGYDPSLDAPLGIFTAAFNQYVRSDLKWTKSDEYRSLANVHPWDYNKASNRYLNVSEALSNTMTRNPSLRVFVANGYYDLATPFFATEYTFSHLNLPSHLKPHVSMGYYEGGHMMFIDQRSLVKLSEDLHQFVENTLKNTDPTQTIRDQ